MSKPSAPLVYVIVVTYDGKRYLEGCFRTLLNTPCENVRVLLVDNGSSDGSGEFVRETFPEVEIFRIDVNDGFIRAANAAIRYVADQGADYVVLCNDDIELIDDRWLQEAVACAENDPRVGIVGFKEESTRVIDRPAEVLASDGKYLVGFALLYPMPLLEKVGLLDDGYNLYAVETDLEARIRMAGYRIVQLNIPVYHLGGGSLERSSRRAAFLQMSSGLRYCLKNRHPVKVFARMVSFLDVGCNPWPLTYNPHDHAHCRMRNTGNVMLNSFVLLRAVIWNIVRLPSTLRARWRDRRAACAARVELARCVLPRHMEPITHDERY